MSTKKTRVKSDSSKIRPSSTYNNPHAIKIFTWEKNQVEQKPESESLHQNQNTEAAHKLQAQAAANARISSKHKTEQKTSCDLAARRRKTKTGNRELMNENLMAVKLRPWSRYEFTRRSKMEASLRCNSGTEDK
jgi:hypothetical protein